MRIVRFTLILLTTVLVVTEAAPQEKSRPRAREAGVIVGVLQPGPLNAITDVVGVAVGHKTLIRGDNVRTGVTAILPHNGNLFREKVPGAVFIGNAFGKLAGSTQVNELGEDETIYLKPLKDLLSQGKCPADVLLEKWEGELHRDIKRLIAYSAYKRP